MHNLQKVVCIVFVIGTVACQRNSNQLPSAAGTPVGVPLVTNIPFGLTMVQYYEGSQASLSQNVLNPDIDILVSVDNSGSVPVFANQIKNDLELWTSDLSTQKIKYQFGFVKGNSIDDNGTQNPKLQGPYPIVLGSSQNTISSVDSDLTTLLATYPGQITFPASILPVAISTPANSGLFESGAHLIFVLITSGPDRDTWDSSQSVINTFDQFATNSSWIAVSLSNASACPGDWFNLSQLVVDLVSNKGGSQASLCETDYRPFLNAGVTKVLSLFTKFNFSRFIPTPYIANPQSFKVTVGNQSVADDPATGFQWDSTNNALTFLGSYVPPAGSTVEVAYEYIVP